MSDIKRVVLTTLEPQKVCEKSVKKHCKTVRICVALPESNEDKCPEYNYKDELASVKKKVKQNGNKESGASNGLDPLENDNDDDVRRIALEMEAKYGSGVINKKKRKARKDDYADIGAGYDENDSFIDNTDGYDEIIPPNVTTARGGFYINSGALEFKEDQEATSEVSSSSSSEEESESEEEEGANTTKRKRALDTTDEEDAADGDNSSQGEKKQNVDKPNISMHQAIKKKLFSQEKIRVKKRRLADAQSKKTVKNLLEEKRTDSDNTEKDALKENKRPMKLSSVDDAIESVISRAEELVQNPPESNEPRVEVSRKEDRTGDQQFMETETTNEPAKIEIVKLPENLPADILEIVENIKKSAREYKDGGKVKFFSGEVNVMLLNLERKCKVLGKSSRVKVYEHLAPFVRCRKETLIKRAKNLVIEEEQKRLKRTLEKLKNHVDQLMPTVISNHEKECQKVLLRKFSQEAATNEELKNLKAPRRRFQMSEDIRRMIRDIVSFKKRCLLHEGKQKESLEDLLTEYLKKEILVLWPEGWMSMAVLKKFCTTMAIKTPDPKSVSSNINPISKHSQKPQTSSTSSTIINFSSGNNLTITPVNLSEKLNEVGNNNGNGNLEPDTIIKPVIKENIVEIPSETTIKPVNINKHIKENIVEKSQENLKPVNKDIVTEKLLEAGTKQINKEKQERQLMRPPSIEVVAENQFDTGIKQQLNKEKSEKQVIRPLQKEIAEKQFEAVIKQHFNKEKSEKHPIKPSMKPVHKEILMEKHFDAGTKQQFSKEKSEKHIINPVHKEIVMEKQIEAGIEQFNKEKSEKHIKPVHKEIVTEKQFEAGFQQLNKEKSVKPVHKEIVTEKQFEAAIRHQFSKEKSEKPKENKDNGVIVINSIKSKEEAVIPKALPHYQVIDLTESPLPALKTKPMEEPTHSYHFSKEPLEPKPYHLSKEHSNPKVYHSSKEHSDHKVYHSSKEHSNPKASYSSKEHSVPKVYHSSKEHSNPKASYHSSKEHSDHKVYHSSKEHSEPKVYHSPGEHLDPNDPKVYHSSKEHSDLKMSYHSSKEHSDSKVSSNFENAKKHKFPVINPGINVPATNTHDRDDVQKVMESLKALQKLSSPLKNEATTSSPVSVIAFNKNYSNSNSSQTSSTANNERTNFSGAFGFQDEFQKQFISSLNNHKTPSPPSKNNYNRCS